MDADLPVFPVRNGVLFPGAVAPFDLGRPRTRVALQEAQKRDPSLLFVVAQRDPHVEDPDPSELHPVGCIAEVLDRLPNIQGGDRVILRGLERAAIREMTRASYVSAKLSRFAPEPPLTHPQRSRVEEIREWALEIARAEGVPEAGLELLAGLEEHAHVVDLVAANLTASVDVKARWLAAPLVERIALVLEFVRAYEVTGASRGRTRVP